MRLLFFLSAKLDGLIGYFRIDCPSLYRLMVSNTMRRCWRLGPDLRKGCLFYVSYESGSLIASKTAITCTIASVISQLPHRQAGRQARWIRYHLKAGDHAGEEQVPSQGRVTRRGAGTTYRQGPRRGTCTTYRQLDQARSRYRPQAGRPGEETEAILQIIAVFDAIKEPNSYET